VIDGLEARLTTLAALGQTLTYGALAAELALDEPGRIAKLTTALETLMEQDAATGQPLRASLVIGRATGGLPARGFFDKARALGYDVTDPIAFHKAQLRACFAQMRP
jgi:hypothetical protein